MRATAAGEAPTADRAVRARGIMTRGEGPSTADPTHHGRSAASGPSGLRACASAVVPLALAASVLALPISLPAQVLSHPAPRRRVRPSAWPELPTGHVCPQTADSLPGRENFLSIRKFSPVHAVAGCSARWSDGLHRHFFRGSPPNRRGIECLGTSFGVNHVIDLRRPDEIQIDSRDGGFRSEQEAVDDFNQRHPDRPIRYVNVQTGRDTPRENERQILNVVRYVQQALRDDPTAVFYLHCRAGRDRTGVMVAAIESLVGECPWPEVRRQLFAYRFDRSFAYALLHPLERALGVDPQRPARPAGVP